MTLIEIVEKYLADNGFDGLYSHQDCACKKGDLFPCGSPFDDCKPGYLFTDADNSWFILEDKP